MYRRLKNILGTSLMALAVVISQIPMPEAQAVVMKEMTEVELEVDDASAHVVTFSMNGGTFRGDYNDYRFQDKTPVLVIDDGKKISSFPDDKYASYSGYKTEADTWYTDKECLTKYDADGSVTESITLYKKWYNITSDGTTLAPEGFYISADGTVLYRYDGKETLVEIPAAVTTIADGAFENLAQEVRGIKLPAGIGSIGENAFRGIQDGRIVYLYDSATDASREYGKQLASQYGQLVYSDYLDLEKTEEIVGINYLGDTPQEEAAETSERVRRVAPGRSMSGNDSDIKTTADETDDLTDNTAPSDNGNAEDHGKPSDDNSTQNDSKPSDDDNTQNDSKPSESGGTESADNSTQTSGGDGTGTPGEEEGTSGDNKSESSSTIVIDPDQDQEQEYTITFDIGISGVKVEQKKVSKGENVSESVSVDGRQPEILGKGTYQIRQDDGKQEIVYTFKGWYKDDTTEWDFSEDVVENDTTLHAKWDKQTRAYFYVTYSATQGNESATNIPGRQKLYGDQNLEKPANMPSIADKTFKGWYTSASGGTEYTSWGKPVTGDMTLYAHFEKKTETKTETKTNTVTFDMNGGSFTGSYNGNAYTNAASLTAKITAGQKIAAAVYPEGSNSTSVAIKYSNYTTDTSWYKDKECLEVYNNDTTINGDITLYKKWYHTSSGFTMNASDNVLYKYSGSVEKVTIPDSVTVIGSDAFASVGGISSIILPDNISVVKENAFSGINKISKDIIITGRTEKAQNVAKELASQYTRLVYEGGDAAQDNDAVVISKTASGSIKLGATISGNTGTAGTNTGTAAANNTSTTGTIVLGTGSTGTAAANNTSTTGTIVIGDDSADTADADTAGVRTATVSQPTTGSQSATASPGTVTSAQQDTSGSAASAAQRTETTQKQNATSASAPRSTQHIKDSTPKTGDPLQYRMLVVCAMFSVGVLLVLTGNGKKKRFSAS